MKTKEEKKEAQVLASRKYNSSPKAKAAQERYRSTDKYVETRRRRLSRPEVISAVIKSVTKYNNSDAGSVKYKINKYRSRIKRTYGITTEQYDEMLINQNGLCAVCHELCRSGKRLAIDHDHNSGVVRGLLCSGCNLALGSLRENSTTARRLADYIDNSILKEKYYGLKSAGTRADSRS